MSTDACCWTAADVDNSLIMWMWTDVVAKISTLTHLMVSLLLTCMDYCNAVLTGLPSTQLNRLQSVINDTAHLMLSGCRRDHITPLLVQLHWLHVPDKTEYKLCILVYRCLHGMATKYLANSFQLPT